MPMLRLAYLQEGPWFDRDKMMDAKLSVKKRSFKGFTIGGKNETVVFEERCFVRATQPEHSNCEKT